MRESEGLRARTPLPTAKAVRDVLEGVLGRDIELGIGQPVVPSTTIPATVAIYRSRGDTVRAAVAVDLPLSASLSSAIGLLPTDVVLKAIEEKRLGDESAENLREVLNVLTSSLNGDGCPHVSLTEVAPLGERPPTDVAILLRTLGRRLDQKISIRGYGEGYMSIVCI